MFVAKPPACHLWDANTTRVGLRRGRKHSASGVIAVTATTRWRHIPLPRFKPCSLYILSFNWWTHFLHTLLFYQHKDYEAYGLYADACNVRVKNMVFDWNGWNKKNITEFKRTQKSKETLISTAKPKTNPLRVLNRQVSQKSKIQWNISQIPNLCPRSDFGINESFATKQKVVNPWKKCR